MKIEEALEIYLHDLMVNQNKAIATVQSYQTDLKQYFNYLHKVEISDMNEINHQIIIDYITEITAVKQPRTVSHALSSIRSFHQFIHIYYTSIIDPSIKIKTIKPQKQLPKFYTEQELDKLFDSFKDSEIDIFQRAIFELLYACGLRVSELCQLTFNQINFENRMLRVLGKGNKERLVPIAKYSLQRIEEYLPIRKKWDKHHSHYLFINQRGNPISRQYVWSILHKKEQELGINLNYSPHTIRHTFATDLLAGGADLRTVQELLGHSNIATTQIYTHIQQKQLHKMYDQFHPRNNQEEEDE